MNPKDYPLAWPPGHRRTKTRMESRFKVSFEDAYNALFRLCTKLHTDEREFIISTNVPITKRGLPDLRSVEDVRGPGVAVYIWRKGKPFVFACDTYDDVRSNIRAVWADVAVRLGQERTQRRHGVAVGAVMTDFLTPMPSAEIPVERRIT